MKRKIKLNVYCPHCFQETTVEIYQPPEGHHTVENVNETEECEVCQQKFYVDFTAEIGTGNIFNYPYK